MLSTEMRHAVDDVVSVFDDTLSNGERAWLRMALLNLVALALKAEAK
jgi:hypothetical protein